MADRPDHGVTNPTHPDLSSDDKALHELRALLLSEEQKQILHLRERLDDLQQRSKETSRVVAEAIHLRHQQGGEIALREALAPSVHDALRESIRRDPSILADVLFPVMGPAIRKSVAEALRAMIEFFNNALNASLSLQGLKWRLEAIRTGRPYAEVALLRSLIYRVERVFIFHRKTSLLLLHAVASDVAVQDAGMVAGMLSAIQDFVHDSFRSAQSDTLESFQVGELQLWIERGPQATLAAVIRGESGQPYRLLMEEKLEKLHRRFGAELEKFEGDACLFESFRPDLAECLVSRYNNNTKRPRPYFVIILLVLLSLLVGWQLWGYLQMRRWRAFVDVLHQEPGIFVTALEKRDGIFRIRGLRDPLAVDPRARAETAGLDARRVEFQWQAFYSLDDAMVLQRVRHVLLPPETAVLSVDHGMLRVAGESTVEWAEQLRLRAPIIPGVLALDDRNLNNPNALLRQKAALESSIILFDSESSELNAGQKLRLAPLLDTLRHLMQSAEASRTVLQIFLVGHSDDTGRKEFNSSLSESRARKVMQGLVQDGIDARYLRARGAGAAEPVRHVETLSDRQYNRSVTFQVRLTTRPN